MKTRIIKVALGILVIAVTMFGSVSVAILSNQIGRDLQVSVVKKATKAKKAKRVRKSNVMRRVASELIAAEASFSAHVTHCDYLPPEKTEYKGEFAQKETATWAKEDGPYEITIFLKNTGNVPWFGEASACGQHPKVRLGTARDRDHLSPFYTKNEPSWAEPTRVTMVEPRVEPGETATFVMKGSAPDTTDIYREYFQPVAEGASWFDDATLMRVDMSVGMVLPELEKSLKYLGGSGKASDLPSDGVVSIDIDISEQKMRVKLGDVQIREFLVSSGEWDTPTPYGKFKILNKQELRIGSKWPHYHMPYWQGFTQWGHGLHSLPYLANDRGVFWNEALNHIGQRVSHGCVRILPEDAADLYNITEIGTEIVIHE